LLTGSAGGGKTRLAAEKVHGACLRYPGACWLVMRKAREWNSKSIVPFLAETVIAGTVGVRPVLSEGVFRYDNGSVIYSGGMMGESQREAVRSIGGAGGLDGCWMEEGTAFDRRDYDEVLARLRHDAQGWRQIIVSTNPAGPSHWIYRDLIVGKQATVYLSRAADNPHNAADYLDILNETTGTLRARLVDGRWAQAEGAVYDRFDRNVHVCERASNEFVRWFIGVDEGYTNPAALLLIGEDGDGRLHIEREFYRRSVLPVDIVTEAQGWLRELAGLSAMVYIDDAAAALVASMRSAGIPARSAGKGRVIDGVRIVQQMLIVAGDGRPRLTISSHCQFTIAEFETYSWKPEKDEPVKNNDHAMDALRYVAVAIRRVGGARST
jgi:phage terminase large subunit